MPLYTYRCTLCARETDEFNTIIWRDSAGYCTVCATTRNGGTPLSTAKLERVITPPALRGETVAKT